MSWVLLMLGTLFGIDAEDPHLEHGLQLAYFDKPLTGFLRESNHDGSIRHLTRYVDGERVAAYKWYPGGARAFVKIYRTASGMENTLIGGGPARLNIRAFSLMGFNKAR